jgi:hypothetical protein
MFAQVFDSMFSQEKSFNEIYNDIRYLGDFRETATVAAFSRVVCSAIRSFLLAIEDDDLASSVRVRDALGRLNRWLSVPGKGVVFVYPDASSTAAADPRPVRTMWPLRLVVTAMYLDEERRLARPAHATVDMIELPALGLGAQSDVPRLVRDLARTIDRMLAHDEEVRGELHSELHSELLSGTTDSIDHASSPSSPSSTINPTADPNRGLAVDTDEDDESEDDESEDACAVCRRRNKDGDFHVKLPCEHRFHCGCMHEWTRTCRVRGLPVTCPLCRDMLALA